MALLNCLPELTMREIHGRILVKETVRHPVKTGVDHRLYRPILGTRPVVIIKRMPEYDIFIVDGAISLGPPWQSVPAGVLIREATGGVEFIGGISGNP